MRGAIGPGQGGSFAVSPSVLGGSGEPGAEGGVGGSPTSTPEVTSGGAPEKVSHFNQI